MAEILEAVLALIGLGGLVVCAAAPHVEASRPTVVLDPSAEVLESINRRHQATDAAMRHAAAKDTTPTLAELLRS